MSTTQTIAPQRLDQILEDSVRQQRPLVLTHNGPDGWRTYKAAFRPSASGIPGLTIQVAPQADGAAASAPPVGDTLGGTFRLGHKKCMFCSVILGVKPHADGALWTLRRPDHLQQLQRRAYERAVPPKNEVVAVRFWRDLHGDGPTDARVVRHGQLEDISAGGMRIKVADPKEIELDRTYRCVFTPRPGKPALVLDAVLRHREAGDKGRASLGFQFVGLEISPEGLRLLDRLVRIVNHFHRSAASDVQGRDGRGGRAPDDSND